MKGGRAVQDERKPKKEKEAGALNIRSLKKIVTIMNRAKLTELNIEQDGIKIHLKKGSEAGTGMPAQIAAPPVAMAAPPAAPAPAAAATPAVAAPATEEDGNYYTIKSPMVGTFYRAGSPEAPPYTDVGKEVDENSVVCIVEAMKLMNEIKSEVKGKIKKVMVENAQAVEYGQPLFLVERS